MQHQIARPFALTLSAALALASTGALEAQELPAAGANIVVNGEPAPDVTQLSVGPDVNGTIVARTGSKLKVLEADGKATVIATSETTKVKASSGLFGTSKSKLGTDSLLNGLPVSVKTVQWNGGLLATQVTFKSTDLKTAAMIRAGTAQGFSEQSAATEALRGRLADIDQYNIKATSNVFFDTGKATLSPRAKADLCAAAAQGEATSNALMLVVGYTDSVGSDDYNQALSEKRAGTVINYLQQVCHWKPYRMLTPTGMAKADPLASNDTPEGKAQNRRVSVNILVSKGLDGM
jgi:outer membrane protein OmpA-like peptidoglycan-associated protein